MKILFINGTNNIGGGELSLLSIANYYKQNCSIVSFDKGDYTDKLSKHSIDSIILKNAQDLLNIKRENGIFSLFFKFKTFLLTVLELRGLYKNYGIIYCNSQKAILLGLLAGIGIRKRFIIHVRDMMDNPNISNLQKQIFTLLVNFKKPTIIANSKATKIALENIGVKQNINVIYNGITIPQKTYNKTNEKFIVAMFSRISHWKGQEYFIEAIKKLRDNFNNENMEFWIVGDAVMGSEEERYKNKILKMIKEYHLESSIKLFGFVENPIDYMKEIDVLLLPSIYPEPFGRVVVEAMLLKRVVIATNQGGVTEIIENNISGILVDIENLVQDLYKNIKKVYEDKDYYIKLSTNGYKRAIENFTEEKMLKNIDKIIKGLK